MNYENFKTNWIYIWYLFGGSDNSGANTGAVSRSVMSMVLLFILFMLNWANPEKLKNVNDFLLENMSFFFVPSAVSIITKYDLIKNSIVQILIICVVSFVVTFAVTAYTVTFVMKIQERFRRKRIGSGDEC